MPSSQQPPPAYSPPPAYPAPPYAQGPYPQGPYPQQPAYWPVYPPAPRPRRRWLPWVIVASVLTVGGCGALLGTVGVHFYKQMDGAKTAVDAYLSALERGDLSAAEALICDEAGPAEAQRAAASQITAHRIGNVFVQSNRELGSDYPAHTSASVTVDITLGDNVHHRDVIDVEYEHERWLVCGVTRSEVRD